MKRLLQRLRAAFQRGRQSANQGIATYRAQHHPRWLHPTQHLMHLAYFAGVCVEGHGLYAMVAGSLFFFGIYGLFMGEHEP